MTNNKTTKMVYTTATLQSLVGLLFFVDLFILRLRAAGRLDIADSLFELAVDLMVYFVMFIVPAKGIITRNGLALIFHTLVSIVIIWSIFPYYISIYKLLLTEADGYGSAINMLFSGLMVMQEIDISADRYVLYPKNALYYIKTLLIFSTLFINLWLLLRKRDWFLWKGTYKDRIEATIKGHSKIGKKRANKKRKDLGYDE